MTRRRVLAVLTAAALSAASIPAAPEDPKPQDVGLMERTSARLAQLDVTVSGPKSAIVGLTAADFEVRLNDKLVPNVIVDALCGNAPNATAEAPAPSTAPAAPAASAVPTPPSPSAKGAPVTYLLYFDHPHLTQAGRRASIDAAREMLPKLMTGGNRAMLISNAKDLRTLVPLTTDEGKVEAALAAMVDDNRDFDPYASTEESRMAEITTEIGKNDLDRALRLARQYAREERSRQERDLSRLRIVLGRLAELDPPKAVLYFADTMRQNAGAHYMSFFSAAVTEDRNGSPTAEAGDAQLEASTGGLVLDRVVNEAASYGIRFYTVEGQGLSGPTTLIQAGNSPFTMAAGGGRSTNQATPQYNTQHTKDSQATLVAMAIETGGRAFLNGVAPAKMAAQILDDLSCVYLLSFDPRGFPEDKPLAVSVKVARPKVRTTVRGRLVIQGDSARLTSRLLSAYAAPTAKETTVPLHVGMIPVSYKDGRYQARVQVSVPPTAIPGTTWDLGASVVTRGAVGQEGSGRISLSNAGVPVAWEKDMEFSPGDFELIAVGHETTTDELTSKEMRGSWPNLDEAAATVGPIAVSQPSKGGFLRDGTSRTSGAVVLDEADPVRADTPLAVISLVCRAKDVKKPLTVARTLIGDSETPVGTTSVDMGEDRCAQILDFVRPKTLGAGSYRFVVTVSRGGEELARGERKLFVPEPPQASR